MEGVSVSRLTEPASGSYAFLFSDIYRSTQLWLEDPEGMSTALAVHDEVMYRVIADTGGLLFTTGGDSFHTAYLEPMAALAAAVDARRALSEIDWGTARPLQNRYALHFGWAEWRRWDFFGPEVIRCARLLDVAEPDQIVASSAFTEAVAGTELASFVELGDYPLEGFAEASRVLQVSY